MQDAAVLTKVHGRKHILFDSYPNIFKSDLFNDYADKLLEHLDASFDPNDVDIQTVLPGVLQKFDEQKEALGRVQEELVEIKNYVDPEKIASKIKGTIRGEIQSFSKHMGSALTAFSSQGDDYIQPAQQNLLTQDEPSILAEEGGAVGEHTTTSLTNVPQSMYSIPKSFDTVRDMLIHWDSCVWPNLIVHKSNWKKHLNEKDRKRFSRLQIIITKMERLVENGSIQDDVIQMFEQRYLSCNKSISHLADKFARNM